MSEGNRSGGTCRVFERVRRHCLCSRAGTQRPICSVHMRVTTWHARGPLTTTTTSDTSDGGGTNNGEDLHSLPSPIFLTLETPVRSFPCRFFLPSKKMTHTRSVSGIQGISNQGSRAFPTLDPWHHFWYQASSRIWSRSLLVSGLI